MFFCLETYQNNFFYFLKITFDTSTSKLFENIKKIILSKKTKEKFLNFWEIRFHQRSQPKSTA